MTGVQTCALPILTPADIRARHPFIGTDGILAGLYDPHDGDIDPAQLTQALAKGARDAGAQIHRQTRVTAIERTASGEWRLTTSKGVIQAQKVIEAGIHAMLVGESLIRADDIGDKIRELRGVPAPSHA